MAKMDWEKRNRIERSRASLSEFSWLERAADRVLANGGQKPTRHAPPKRVARTAAKPAPKPSSKQAASDRCDIWRVIGADCPWNPTPGERVVQHITSLAEARRLGLR